MVNVSKTNPNIAVTTTPIANGVRVLIEPFKGLGSENASSAIFKAETFFSPAGKNHNIKMNGTYTGRSNCRLKGVDY
jgi:hypothetical protein